MLLYAYKLAILTNRRKGVDIMNNDSNVANVREEDKEFIRVVTALEPENLNLIKGIVIGLQLQESQPVRATHPA